MSEQYRGPSPHNPNYGGAWAAQDQTAEDPNAPDFVPELSVVTVGASVDLRQAAIDFANHRLTDELNSGGRFRRFMKGFWKGNIAKAYYQSKYTREAERELRESGNFVGGTVGAAGLAEARRSLFERFSLSYDEAIHDEAGESRELMTSDSPFVRRSKELIRQYVTSKDGAFNKASLMQEINRLLKESSEGDNPTLKGAELIAVSNLSEIAEAVKAQVAHGHALEQVLDRMQFISGEARSGVRTDLKEASIEKLAKKVSGNKWARALSPNALLAATTTVASIVGIGGRRLVATALSLVPGAAGAGLAAWRERKRMNEDRVQHARERAQGLKTAEGSKRREQMDGVIYEMKKATDLRDGLQGLRENLFDEEADHRNAVREALNGLANITARIRMGDSQGVDLISFSSSELIGRERMELDIARAELRAELDRILGGLSEEQLTLFGLAERDAGAIANSMAQQYEELFSGKMTERDKAFRKLRRRRMVKAGAAGFASGLTLGLATQELFAALSPDTQGVFSGQDSDGAGRQTLLRSWVHGEHIVGTVEPYDGAMQQNDILEGGVISAPDTLSFHDDGNGLFSMHDKDGNVILEGLKMDAEGRIAPESLALMQEKGFEVTESSHVSFVEGEEVTQTVTYDDPGEYVRGHGGVEISGRSWADNETSVFDKNELRLWEAGVAEDGTIQASIATMTENGSYGQGLPVNWHETQADGNLVALITASRGTQNFAFEIPINADGSFAISPDHPAYRLFTVEPGAEWKAGDNFNGAFIEVAQKTVGEDGRIHAHMLATDIGGDSMGSITEEITVKGDPREVTTYTYDVVSSVVADTVGHTDMAPVIPVTQRKSLERMAEPQGINPYYSREGYWARAFVDRRRADTSPRLLADPSASLDPRTELGDFHGRLTEEDPGRTAALEEIIARNEILNELPADTKGIVTIPVAAAHEARNIYRTLEKFAKQQEGVEDTVVLLNFNWTRGALQDQRQRQKIEKARQEIERFRQQYPNVKVAVIENEYDPADFQRTGGVIGHVAKDLYDTALLAVDRAVQAGRLSDPDNLVLLRADADTLRMSSKYLGNMYRAVREHPRADIFQGATRHGLEVAPTMPGFSILTNFDAALAAADARRGRAYTGNHNYAFRAATFAAVGGIGIGAPEYTGAGSDDIEIAARIRQARGVEAAAGRYGAPRVISGDDSDVSVHVGGAQIESDASRLLPAYIAGESLYMSWNNFSGGAQGYTPRGGSNGRRSEPLDKSVKRLEEGINHLISGSQPHPDDLRRLLTLFFDAGLDGPGYDVALLNSDNRKFKFTQHGRDALRRKLRRFGRGPSQYEKIAARTAGRMV